MWVLQNVLRETGPVTGVWTEAQTEAQTDAETDAERQAQRQTIDPTHPLAYRHPLWPLVRIRAPSCAQ